MNPIILPVNELKPALAGLSKVIGKRTSLPVLGCVKVTRTANGQIQLTGTDLDSHLTALLPTFQAREPLELLVPFDELQHLTKTCQRADELHLVPRSPSKLSIQYPIGPQRAEKACELIPVAEFPSAPEIPNGNVIPLNHALRTSIAQALECASTDQTRLILNGAYLDVSQAKGHYIVGTDGRHLFSSNSFKLPHLKESLVLPNHRFLSGKELGGEGDWQLRVGLPDKDEPPAFELSSANWRFVSQAVHGNYPNWRQVVTDPASAKTKVHFAPELVDELIVILQRMPSHDTVNHGIGLEIDRHQVTLLGRTTADAPWTKVAVPQSKGEGSPVTIHLNRDLLIKALRFGLTSVDIIDPRSPLRCYDQGRQMIVMPLRAETVAPPTPPASTPSPVTPNPPPPAEPTTPSPMPKSNGTQGAERPEKSTATPPASKPSLDSALSQIETVKAHFRDAIRGLNDLTEQLKTAAREQKANEKEIQSVRQTLRSLQSVRI